MGTTVRNLEPRTCRAFQAKASLEGKTIGEAVNEAVRAHVDRPAK